MITSGVPFLRLLPVVFFFAGRRPGWSSSRPRPLLAAIGLLAAFVVGDYVFYIGKEVVFDFYGLGRWAFCIVCATAFEFLTRQYDSARKPGELFSLCTEMLALLYLLKCAIAVAASALAMPTNWHPYLYDFFTVWTVMSLAYGCFQLGGRTVVGAALLVVYGFLLFLAPIMLYASYASAFWYQAEKEEQAEVESVDVERTYYRQQQLVERQLDTVVVGEKGKSELYLVTFVPWSLQQVFWKEVQYVNKLFDERFATARHRMSLVNQRSTIETLPLANLPNLRSSLKIIGQKMNVEEDILVLYLTSHGSREGELSAAFPLLDPQGLSGADLKSALDASGIRWRVVIVSACYSGRFVEALKDEYTIAASAAAKDRKSFGCGNEDEFTYFGEALFKDGVGSGQTLLHSIIKARDVVAAREKREKKTPSNPQLWIGNEMKKKLKRYEREREQPALP